VNKKVLGIVLTVFFLAMLTVPVMAAPATKIEGVTATAMVTQTPNPGFPHMVSDGTISHGKGTSTGTVTLNIPGQDPLVGDWAGEWISMGNFKKDPAELVIMGKMVWTFTGGTFEGIIQRLIIGWPVPLYFEDHMVLQGTGDFKEQTLKLSYEGAPPPVAEGYLVIP
jgi:hypothetical protein